MKNDIELIYIHEGLCGWTYAFNHSLVGLMKELNNKFHLTLISAEVNCRLTPQFKESILKLNTLSPDEHLPALPLGQPFIQKLHSDELSDCNSMALSKAIIAIQKYYPSRTLESLIFFQNKLFIEGKNISDLSSYLGWFYDLGMDGEYLYYFMNGNMAEAERIKNKSFILNLGVTSYPMLLLKNKNRLQIIAKGYMPLEQLMQSISTVLNKVEV